MTKGKKIVIKAMAGGLAEDVFEEFFPDIHDKKNKEENNISLPKFVSFAKSKRKRF